MSHLRTNIFMENGVLAPYLTKRKRMMLWKNTETQFKKLNKLYAVKNIYYGQLCDTYDYYRVQASYKNPRRVYEKSKEGEKSDFSLSRAREKIYRLVEANKRQHGNYKPIFFTLTTKDQLKDHKESNKKIKGYIRRLNNFVGHKIKYIIVPELHKSGAIHYHGVYFNLPFIWIETFKEHIWTHGSVDLQVAKQKIRNTALYITKYLTKEFQKNTPKNTKMYFTSRGLVIPTEDFCFEHPSSTMKIVGVNITKSYIKYQYARNNSSSVLRRSSQWNKQKRESLSRIDIVKRIKSSNILAR